MAEEIAEMPAEITEEKVEEEDAPTASASEEVPEPAPKKRGRPKKEPAPPKPKPEPKPRGRPRKVSIPLRAPSIDQAVEAQSMEAMSYEDVFTMLASRIHDEKTRKRAAKLAQWDAFLPL